MTDHTCSDTIIPLAEGLCEAIGTPRALSVLLCLKYNNDALFELSSTDFANNDTGRVALDYMVTEYFSKYKGLKLSTNPADVALRKWKLAEAQCLETNEALTSPSLREFNSRVENLIPRIRHKIAMVLGKLHLPLVLRDCKWGPGATFDLPRSRAYTGTKHTSIFTITRRAMPYFRALIESDPHWFRALSGVLPDGPFSVLPGNFTVVPGNRLIFVPKNAKTDRVIASEPTGNSYLQQGVHSYLVRRLGRFGIDLSDQGVNQERARRAYTDELCTIDLQSASDTIATELIWLLLPAEWADLLDNLRSPATFYEGKWRRVHKFASMGNAFCFELETLIFWAICEAICEEDGTAGQCTAFGDDLVVPRSSFEACREALTYFGFTLNDKKSYHIGNFFESCGRHFHRGVEITPAYQKELIRHPSEVIRAHNRLFRWVDRIRPQNRFKPVLASIRKMYPQSWPFPRVPRGATEDGGFLTASPLPVDQNHGYICRVLDYFPFETAGHDAGLYSYTLQRSTPFIDPCKVGVWDSVAGNSCVPLGNRIKCEAPGFLGAPTRVGRNTGHCTEVDRGRKGKWRTHVRHIPFHACEGTDAADLM